LKHLTSAGLSPHDCMQLAAINCGTVLAISLASLTTTKDITDLFIDMRNHGLKRRAAGDRSVDALLDGMKGLTLSQPTIENKLTAIECIAPHTSKNVNAQEILLEISDELKWNGAIDRHLATLLILLTLVMDVGLSAANARTKLEQPVETTALQETRAWQIQRYLLSSRKHLRRGEVGALLHRLFEMVAAAAKLAEMLSQEPEYGVCCFTS